MKETPSNKKTYFSGDTTEIISDILKKYSLEETDEELAKKIFGDEPFIIRGGTVLEVAIGLAKKELPEKECVLVLQKDLNISQNIAEELVKEIKIKLIPLITAKKPFFSKPTEEELESIQPIKQPIGVANALSQMQNKNTSYPQTTKKELTPIVEKADNKKIEPPREKRKNDTYRESIE